MLCTLLFLCANTKQIFFSHIVGARGTKLVLPETTSPSKCVIFYVKTSERSGSPTTMAPNEYILVEKDGLIFRNNVELSKFQHFLATNEVPNQQPSYASESLVFRPPSRSESDEEARLLPNLTQT